MPLCLASALAAAVLPALSLAQDRPSPRAFQHHPAPTHPAAGPVGFLPIGPVVSRAGAGLASPTTAHPPHSHCGLPSLPHIAQRAVRKPDVW